MRTTRRSRSVPTHSAGIAVLVASLTVLSGCTASSNPSPAIDVDPSPPPSPVIDPNPSPPPSPVIDPNPSPPPSPVIDPKPSPPPSPVTDPNPSPPPASARWVPSGSMTRDPAWPLADYQAVLMGDGRVLVIGATTAEVWDPTTGLWRATEPLSKERHAFAAVSLADGRVLVAGGLNGDRNGDGAESYSSAYAFDPRSEAWTKVGLMRAARTLPSIARLPDGRILLAGGYFHTGSMEGRADDPGVTLAAYRPGAGDGGSVTFDDVDVPPYGYALATAELFDPATGGWTKTGPLRYARAGAAAVTLSDGRVLIVGSDEANVTGLHADAYRTAELYDPATGRFTLAGGLPDIDRRAVKELGVVLPDGDPEPGPLGALAALRSGGAVLVGNVGWWKHQAEIVRSFRYDVGDASWTEIGDPHAWAFDDADENRQATPGTARVEAQVATLAEGRVLVAGGKDGYQYAGEVAASAELYDPGSNGWAKLPAMPQPRAQGSVVALADGTLLLVGGMAGWDAGGSSGTLATAVRFVP